MDSIVVFLVMSHHKPRLVERLLTRLAEADSAVTVVHHDPTSSESPSLAAAGRATFVPEPVNVRWGDLSAVAGTLKAIRWIIDEIPSTAWIVFLSGQDYPVISPRAVETELLASTVDAFLHWEPVPPVAARRSSDWQRGTSRRYYWHRIPGRFRPVPVPRLRFFFDGVGIFAGSQWWSLNRRAVERILEDSERTDYLLRHRFRSTMIPDEAFFQTALLNSPLDLTIVNDHRRFYRFLTNGGASHPKILTIEDLEEIVSSNAFFARKVDEVISEELLDALDANSWR
jgi:hypothetical protein